ncbi:complex I subunit 5 family protein [Ramlibacter aurantiacus]|nr:proton-conducting transporter membrane subunit [Ramlibacter aurantiacus]
MRWHTFLIAATVLVPLLLAAASAVARQPRRLLPWGGAPGLLCALLVPSGSEVAMPQALLGAALRLDALGAAFLGLCAFIWTCAALYGRSYVAGQPHERMFCGFWQLTLAGSLGVCLAADAITFYLAFATVSLPAYVLVIHDRAPGSLRAGRVYIALAVLGEMALLMGLMLSVDAAGSIGIEAVRQALAQAPWRDAAVLGLLVGLGLKCGLVPLHGWLPLAHSAAPVPASAVLSGAIVKAGLIGLMRFLPADQALPVWPEVLTWTGLLTAYAAVLLGLAQQLPKAVLAYSTMSQMGLMVAVLGAALGAPDGPAAGYLALTLLALQHGLAKGGLFLSAGLLARESGRVRLAVLAAAALMGAVIAGLPLSGGAIAKLATKEPLGTGWAATLAGWSAAGTALLMLRFLFLEKAGPAGAAQPAPAAMRVAFGVMVVAALAAPWWFSLARGGPTLAELGSGSKLWSAAWPLLLATALALVAGRSRGGMPAPPVGDLAAWGESAWAAWWRRDAEAGPGAAPPPSGWGGGAGWTVLERLARPLAGWPAVAAGLGLSVLVFVLALS